MCRLSSVEVEKLLSQLLWKHLWRLIPLWNRILRNKLLFVWNFLSHLLISHPKLFTEEYFNLCWVKCYLVLNVLLQSIWSVICVNITFVVKKIWMWIEDLIQRQYKMGYHSEGVSVDCDYFYGHNTMCQFD